MNDEDVGSDDSDDWLSERDGSEETEGTAESVPVSVPVSGSKAESGLASVAELGESEPGPEPGPG